MRRHKRIVFERNWKKTQTNKQTHKCTNKQQNESTYKPCLHKKSISKLLGFQLDSPLDVENRRLPSSVLAYILKGCTSTTGYLQQIQGDEYSKSHLIKYINIYIYILYDMMLVCYKCITSNNNNHTY